MGGKYVLHSIPTPKPLNKPTLTFIDRVFLAEARAILAKMVFNFDMQLADPENWDWLDQKAYLVFEPKALGVLLKERGE